MPSDVDGLHFEKHVNYPLPHAMHVCAVLRCDGCVLCGANSLVANKKKFIFDCTNIGRASAHGNR